MAKKVLLTGGAGYIGSHTCVALLASGYEVVLLDNFSNAREDVPDRIKELSGARLVVHRGDIRDTALVRRILADHGIDAVIHLAAHKSVHESVVNPILYVDDNIGGLISLIHAMQAENVFNLVFSSSAAVYGKATHVPISEDAALGFVNPYAFTKFAGEQALAYLAAADPRWVIGVLRYFNPAGAHPSGLIGEEPRDPPANLIPAVAEVALGRTARVRVYGNDYDTPDGTGVRDYIHVDDLAFGHVLSMRSLLATGSGHVVNLGTGRGYSVLEVIAAYSAACGRELPYVILPRRSGDVAMSFADPRRAETLLGFKARRNLADMCETSWAWVSGRGRPS